MARPAFEAHVYGLDELTRGSRRLVDNIDEAAPEEFGRVAARRASATRARVPHRSGRMAASVVSGAGRERAYLGYDGSARYAGWVDFGGTRGRPYVRTGRYLFPTAFAAVESPLEGAGEEAARDEIRRMRWPRPTKW
jgi:hypothetical protein